MFNTNDESSIPLMQVNFLNKFTKFVQANSNHY